MGIVSRRVPSQSKTRALACGRIFSSLNVSSQHMEEEEESSWLSSLGRGAGGIVDGSEVVKISWFCHNFTSEGCLYCMYENFRL